MKRSFLVGAAAVGLLSPFIVVGLSAQPAAPSLPIIAGPPGPPPREPCIFPGSQELAALAAVSDLVAMGTVDGAQVVHYAGISSPYSRHMLHIQSILRGTYSTGSLVIEELGGVPVPILQPGPYVVFLVKTSRTDGLTSYFLADGLYGAFPVRAKGVVRECPTFPASTYLPEASGSGVAVADFISEIRNLPATASRQHK